MQDFHGGHERNDWHDKHATGPPAGHQSRAKVLPATRGTDEEQHYCNKLFPRPPVLPGQELLIVDPHRPGAGSASGSGGTASS